MLIRKNPAKVCLRYVYILDVDNHDQRSRHGGHTHIFYTGETVNLKVRINQHVNQVHSKFLTNNYPDSSLNLVYVEYFYGNGYEVLKIERRIKRMKPVKKRELIKSDSNVLRCYKPMKLIVLRKYGEDCEEVIDL